MSTPDWYSAAKKAQVLVQEDMMEAGIEFADRASAAIGHPVLVRAAGAESSYVRIGPLNCHQLREVLARLSKEPTHAPD